MAPLGAMADPEPDGFQEDSVKRFPQDFSDPPSENHWVYGQLSDLMKEYGCVAGFPGGTLRGEEPATRYQVVALLNSCLTKQRFREHPPHEHPGKNILPDHTHNSDLPDLINLIIYNHINDLTKEECPDLKECPKPGPPKPTCSDSQSTPDLESLGNFKKVTTLIIKNNDALENLHLLNVKNLRTLVIRNNDKLKRLDFSDQQPQVYKNLRELVIKNNDELTELNKSGIEFNKLTNVNINNNDKLGDLQLLKKSIPRGNFSHGSLITNHLLIIKNNNVIKHDKCLRELKLKDLNNLRELRIENNDNLIKIELNGRQLSNGEASINSRASPHYSGHLEKSDDLPPEIPSHHEKVSSEAVCMGQQALSGEGMAIFRSALQSANLTG